MTASRYSVGTVVAGEGTLEVYPLAQSMVTKPGIQFVHGANSDSTYCIQPDGNQAQLTKLITDAGFTGISGTNNGPASWGNVYATNSIGAHRTKLQSMAGVTPGKIAIVCASMGGLNALNWAAANPTQVSCIVAVIPVINLTDVVTNNRGGFGPTANAAYGNTYSEATFGATRNSLTEALAGKFAGIPMLIFYGLTDAICLPTYTEQFAAACGANVTLVSMPSGHDWTSYATVDQPAVLAFLEAHA